MLLSDSRIRFYLFFVILPEDCPDGYHGPHCNRTCPDCAHGKTNVYTNRCNGIGQCICLPGWEGATCAEECSNNFYGELCGNKCNCSPCHHINGCQETATTTTVSSTDQFATVRDHSPRITTMSNTDTNVYIYITVGSLFLAALSMLMIIHYSKRQRTKRKKRLNPEVSLSHSYPGEDPVYRYQEVTTSTTEYSEIRESQCLNECNIRITQQSEYHILARCPDHSEICCGAGNYDTAVRDTTLQSDNYDHVTSQGHLNTPTKSYTSCYDEIHL